LFSSFLVLFSFSLPPERRSFITSSTKVRELAYVARDASITSSRQETFDSAIGGRVVAEKGFEPIPSIMSRRYTCANPKFTMSSAVKAGANSRSNISASKEPTRNTIIVPTLPKTALRTSSSICSTY